MKTEIVRAKVGVRDPRKILSCAPLNDEEYIYDIFFELEDIVEEGGPMTGGILISNSGGAGMLSSQNDSNNNNVEKRDGEALESSQTSKSPRNNPSGVRNEVNSAGGEESVEVLPSQYEIDKNLQEEREAREKLLEKKKAGAYNLSAIEEINERFAKDTEMLDNLELDDGEKTNEELEDSDETYEFGKGLGLGTQILNDINEKVAMEFSRDKDVEGGSRDKENICPDVANKMLMPAGAGNIAGRNERHADGGTGIHNKEAEARI